MGNKKSKSKADNHELRIFTSAFQFTDFCLVTSESDLKAVCKYLGISKQEMGEIQKDAQVDFFFTPNGERLVVLRVKDSDHDLCDILGLIVHEITHIKQQIMEDIGEKNPSSEFEAYMIQDLTCQIFAEYFRQQSIKKDK